MQPEPIGFLWDGGEASMGYLGRRRWRIHVDGQQLDIGDVHAAVERVLAAVFRDVAPRSEAALRSPLRITLPGDRLTLLAEPKLVNGWRFSSSTTDATVGPHDQLAPFIAAQIASVADRAWAGGVTPIVPASLARFSFDAFANSSNPALLCRALEGALQERMQEHPSPTRAFVTAMKELKAAGHDLWSLTSGAVWGPDYVTPRAGAGLSVTCFDNDDDDDDDGDDDGDDEAMTVKVEFAAPLS